jgi:hypothetical protein
MENDQKTYNLELADGDFIQNPEIEGFEWVDFGESLSRMRERQIANGEKPEIRFVQFFDLTFIRSNPSDFWPKDRVSCISPNRQIYTEAGSPYGKNRRSMKRWLRDIKAGKTTISLN